MKLLYEGKPHALLAAILQDPAFWYHLRANLTRNQWKWIYYHIIDGLSIEAIAIQENTTVEMVNNWGRQVTTILAGKIIQENNQHTTNQRGENK